MGLNWQELYSERARNTGPSPIASLLGFGSRPDIISLAGGFPASELFPVEAFREALHAVMASEGRAALQYGPTEGHLPLREFLAVRLARFGISAGPEELLITNGSQQGLDLLSRLFVDSDSAVVVEDPTYVGALDAFGGCRARYLAVPTDNQGMQVERLEELLPRARPIPRLIYVQPSFQNPAGGTLSLERRQQLLELSRRHGIPVVEDDPCGELRYEGEHLPPLKAMDGEGDVVYLGTFSKILAPGLRLGWVVAPREVIQRLAAAKQTTDIHTDSLAQRAVHEVCRTGLLDEHIERVKTVYRERRDVMLRSLAQHLPAGAICSRPEGGLFLWLRLPEGMDAAAMLPDALREGMVFVPGAGFHAHGNGANTLRLNFSSASPDQIEEAIARLGRVLVRWSGQGEAADAA